MKSWIVRTAKTEASRAKIENGPTSDTSRQMQTLRRFIKREVSDVVAAFQSFCGAAGVRADKGAPHHEFGISDGQRAIDPDRPNPRAILDSSALQNNFGSARRCGETRISSRCACQSALGIVDPRRRAVLQNKIDKKDLPGLTCRPCPSVVILHAEADKGRTVVMHQRLGEFKDQGVSGIKGYIHLTA